MLEYLDRKLQKFNQGDNDGDLKDIVIQSLGMREARSQRKTETIRERLHRMLFDFTHPWGLVHLATSFRRWPGNGKRGGWEEQLDCFLKVLYHRRAGSCYC
jgi:L-rhamnose isomerase